MAEELEMAGVRGELDVIRGKRCVIRRTGQPYYRGYPLAACLYRAGCRKKKAIGQGIPLEEYEKQKQRLAELIEDYEEEEASELILKLQEQGADEKQK